MLQFSFQVRAKIRKSRPRNVGNKPFTSDFSYIFALMQRLMKSTSRVKWLWRKRRGLEKSHHPEIAFCEVRNDPSMMSRAKPGAEVRSLTRRWLTRVAQASTKIANFPLAKFRSRLMNFLIPVSRKNWPLLSFSLLPSVLSQCQNFFKSQARKRPRK